LPGYPITDIWQSAAFSIYHHQRWHERLPQPVLSKHLEKHRVFAKGMLPMR
jgi:hypothetical protein